MRVVLVETGIYVQGSWPIRKTNKWGVELTKKFFNKNSYAIRAVQTRYPPRAVVRPAVHVIFWIAGTEVCLALISDVSFLRYPSESWMWRNKLCNPLRLFQLRSFELFWRLESYYITMMDILWISLHPNKSPTDLYGSGYWRCCCDCVLPYI